MHSSIFVREHSKTSPKLLSLLAFAPFMGGGPRTFPDGLSKWHWNRLHEKKSKEKEKRLLDQEKLIYEARVRSEVRAKLAGKCDTEPKMDPIDGPMTADNHIRALADQFVKAGAEDLWNNADGPIKSRPHWPQRGLIQQSIHSPIDLRKLMLESHKALHTVSLNGSQKPRCHSVRPRTRTASKFKFRRNESSTSEDSSDSEYGLERQSGGNQVKWPRFGSRGDDSSDDNFSDNEEKERRGAGGIRRPMTNAALGNYDMKKTKRIPLKFLEMEENLSERVEAIRNEVRERNLMGKVLEKGDKEDSILSEKRYMNYFSQ